MNKQSGNPAKTFFAIKTVIVLFFVLKYRFQTEFSSIDDAKTGDKEVHVLIIITVRVYKA